jgi:flagellar protein FlaG
MDVRPISGSVAEPRPIPLREEARGEVSSASSQGPAASDVSPLQWVKPVEHSSDIQAFSEHLAEAVNQALRNMRYSLQFVVNGKGKDLTVRVLDAEGEVVREIPPEEIQKMQERLLEMMGVLFDRKEG